MLGTRVILMGSMQHPLGEAFSDAEIVCAANYEIPLFWLLAFKPDNLAFFTTEEGDAYPILIAERTQAIAQLKEHFQQLGAQLTAQESTLHQTWISYLEQLKFSFLTVDTYELWRQQEQAESLHQQLSSELEMIASIPVQVDTVLEDWQTSGRWQRDNALTLCGYGW